MAIICIIYYSSAILVFIWGICMKSDRKKQREITESRNRLLKELDKGIDAMENGYTMPHDKVMQMIRSLYVKKINSM